MTSTKNIIPKLKIKNNYHKLNFYKYPDIELSAIYSQDKDTFKIFKLLLNKEIEDKAHNINKYNETINKVLRETIKYIDTAHINAIKLLIECNTDINSTDDGETLLMLACNYKINYKESSYVNPYSNAKITQYYVIYKLDKIIQLLIENGCDVNIKDKNNNTALQNKLNNLNSLYDDNLKLIKLLISKTYYINYKNIWSKDNIFKNSLNCIGQADTYDIIKLLLDYKADLYYLKDKRGVTIIDYCKNVSSKKYDIYSLIFNHRNLKNDCLSNCDIDFIYHNL